MTGITPAEISGRAVHEPAEPEPPVPGDDEITGYLGDLTDESADALERLEKRKQREGRVHKPTVTEQISYGDFIHVQDATGQGLRQRAVSPVVEGDNGPVVWLCTEDEWQAAREQGREPKATPWPVEDVAPEAEQQEVPRDA